MALKSGCADSVSASLNASLVPPRMRIRLVMMGAWLVGWFCCAMGSFGAVSTVRVGGALSEGGLAERFADQDERVAIYAGGGDDLFEGCEGAAQDLFVGPACAVDDDGGT